MQRSVSSLIQLGAGVILALFSLSVQALNYEVSNYSIDGLVITRHFDPPFSADESTLLSAAEQSCVAYASVIQAQRIALGYINVVTTNDGVVNYNFPSSLIFNCQYDQTYSRADPPQDYILTDLINDNVDFYGIIRESNCQAGNSEWIPYPVGTVTSYLDTFDLIIPYCLDSCEYDPNIDINPYKEIVNPALYGCTYDQNGFVSGCTDPTAPVQYLVPYVSNGQSCTVSGSGVETDIAPDNLNIDLSETNLILTDIKTEETEQTGILQSILDYFDTSTSLPDAEVAFDNDPDFLDIKNKISGIGDGTFKPFGNGLSSTYPAFTYSGTCILENFDITVQGYSATVDLIQYCEYFDILRGFMDLSFFLLTWAFVYYQFTNAWRDI